MDHRNFNYSLKNIPIPNKQNYTKLMIEMTQKFLKRIRWKAFFFENPELNKQDSRNFGFKSEKSPPQNKDFLQFENDMYSMIKKIKFKETRPSPFQLNLSKDLKEMKKSKHLYVEADKTTNVY